MFVYHALVLCLTFHYFVAYTGSVDPIWDTVAAEVLCQVKIRMKCTAAAKEWVMEVIFGITLIVHFKHVTIRYICNSLMFWI